MTHLPGSHQQQWKINLLPDASTPSLLLRQQLAAGEGQKRSSEEAGLRQAEHVMKKAATHQLQHQLQHQQRTMIHHAEEPKHGANAGAAPSALHLQQAAASRAGLQSPPTSHHGVLSQRAAAELRNFASVGNGGIFAALNASSSSLDPMLSFPTATSAAASHHLSMFLALQRQQQQQQQDLLGVAGRLETILMRQRMAAATLPPVSPLPHQRFLAMQQQMEMDLSPNLTAAAAAVPKVPSATNTTSATSTAAASADRINAVDAMLQAIKSKSPTVPIGGGGGGGGNYSATSVDNAESPKLTGTTKAGRPKKARPDISQSSHKQLVSQKNKTAARRPTKQGLAAAAGPKPPRLAAVKKEQDDSTIAALPPIVPTAENPVGRPLGIDEDCNWLSELHSFMRLHMVELCLAKEEDVAHRRVHKPSVDGFQIGIRCRCCAHLPPGDREPRSTAFPSAMSQLYQSFAMMLRDHFSKCRHMPPPLRQRFLQLKEKTTQGASDAKQYWVYAAQKLGLQDSAEGLVLSAQAQVRAASMLPFGASPEDDPLSANATAALVTTQDKECGAPDLAYTLLLLVRPVTLTAQERKGHKKSLQVGLPGFACRYCCELNRRGNCRFFPVRKRTLAGKLDELYEHFERCSACPKADKDLLRALKARQDASSSSLPGAADDDKDKPQKMTREMKGFVDVVWSRINSYQ